MPPANSPSVLIVDDDDIIRQSLRSVLELDGYEIVEQTNGTAAVAACKQRLPDVVLMDIRMPILDGITACAQIQRLAGGDRVPVLMITAVDDLTNIDRCFDAGAADYITKPLNQAVLRQRVRRLIRMRQAEDALRATEQKYRSVFEASRDALFIIDMTTSQILDANPAGCELYGYRYKEITGLTIANLSAEPARTAQTLRDRREYVPLRYHQKRDGTIFPIEATLSYYTLDGRDVCTTAIRDITERKQIEDALRRSEASLAEAQRMAHFGSWTWDLATGKLQCSDEMFRMVGLHPQEVEVTQEVFLKFLHPDEVEWILQEIQRSFASEPPAGIEHRITRSNGEIRNAYSRVKVYRDENGNPLRLLGSTQDITDRKQAEVQIERNMHQLAALEHMGQTVVASLDLAVVLSRVIEEISSLLGAEGVSVLLIEDRDELVFAATDGNNTGLIGQRMPVGAGIAGEVVRTGQSVRVHDSADQARIYRDIDQAIGFHTESLLAVPLNLRGEIIGVMEAVHTQPGAFSSDELRLLEAAANWSAIAINNARQHTELQRRLEESQAMAAIGQALNETLDLDRVLQLIAVSARRIIPNVKHAVIHLLDESQQYLKPVAVDGLNEHVRPQLILHPGQGVAGQVIRQGKVINISDTRHDERYVPLEQMTDLRSLLVAPVQSGPQQLGTISVQSATPWAFSAEDEYLLATLGIQAAIAIKNARLFETERRHVQEQAALLEITQLALSSFEFSLPALKHIAQRIAQVCHASQCLFFLLEEQASAIRPVVAQYADGREDPAIQQVLEIIAVERLDTLPGLCTIMRERRLQLFKDTRQAGLLPDEWWRLFGLQQALAVPLLGQTEAIGLMVLGYEADQAVGDSQFDLALTIGAQIAIAFANTYLYADLQRALQHERDARAQVVWADKLTAIGRLAASVAHELNNPLQAIQNSLYLVRQESILDKQAQDDLDVALTESRRMADLIERMRETYRPTTATEFRPESLNALITEVEKLISTHLRHSEVTFEFKPEPQLPLVPSLRDQLKQVILNISLNAVDAMPHGGRLTISTSMSPKADGIWLTLTDTGQGIAPEDLPNIFEPFFTQKVGGTGLGLAISYDIVQHHHGRIEVESELGHGTTFRIWLPTKGP